MRKVIEKGTFVRVIKAEDRFSDMEEFAKENGGDEDKLYKSVPKNGMTGTVIGVKDGYCLIDFDTEGFQDILDVSAIETTKRKEEVKFIVVFLKTNLIKEYSTEKEIEKELEDLMLKGHIKQDDQIKVYNIDGCRVVKMKIDVVLS